MFSHFSVGGFICASTSYHVFNFFHYFLNVEIIRVYLIDFFEKCFLLLRIKSIKEKTYLRSGCTIVPCTFVLLQFLEHNLVMFLDFIAVF